MHGLWRRIALALVLAGSCCASSSLADDYPSRSVRLIVPYAPGGGADTVARLVARRVSDTIGQTVVIENRGGAGAIIGTEMVAKAEPDGYTLLLGQSGPISINPAVYKDLRYDPIRDFSPITMTTAYPYILAVNAKLPVKSLQEFVALAKSKPGALNYGTTGIGAANHLVTELFSSKAGLKMTHIPYRGTALAVADLVAGQVTMVFGDPVSVLPHMNAGTLRALAVTSPQRSPVAPQVPTMAEGGFPDVEAVAWHGIFAPARTPTAIIDKLHAEIVRALQNPDIKELLSKQAMQPVGDTPQEFAAFMRREHEKWSRVISAANIRVE